MRALPFLGLLLLAITACTSVPDSPVKDRHIVLGSHVGPIQKGMTFSSLKTLFGDAAVQLADIQIGEGETLPGAKLFTGTDLEIEIIFSPESTSQELGDLRILGRGWIFDNGLKQGLSLEAVEQINGGPFGVLGFGWDYGGYANFEGGKLEAKVSLHFETTTQNVDDSLIGDKLIPTTDPKLRAAAPTVDEISVIFR